MVTLIKGTATKFLSDTSSLILPLLADGWTEKEEEKEIKKEVKNGKSTASNS